MSPLEPQVHDTPTCKFKAVIEVHPKVAPQGGILRLSCEAHFLKGGEDVYNPFIWEHYKLPAQIIITSRDGKVRRELLRPAKGLSAGPPPRAWFSISDGNVVGREFVIKIAPQPADNAGGSPTERAIDLPPGEYYAQAIFNHWLIAQRLRSFPLEARPPGADPKEPQPIRPWSVAQMDQPMAISKPVKFVVTDEAQPAPKFLHETTRRLSLELSPTPVRARLGQWSEVQIGMVNCSDKPIEVYNPTLNRRYFLHRAVVLAVLTTDGEYLGDLFFRDSGSSVMLQKSVWVTLPPGGIISNKFAFRAGFVPRVETGTPEEMPPGRYVLELRAHDHLVTGRPDLSGIEVALRAAIARALEVDPSTVGAPLSDESEDDAKDRISYRDWERTFPGPELVRSARVPLEVMPRTGD